jgi:hypothetical protein
VQGGMYQALGLAVCCPGECEVVDQRAQCHQDASTFVHHPTRSAHHDQTNKLRAQHFAVSGGMPGLGGLFPGSGMGDLGGLLTGAAAGNAAAAGMVAALLQRSPFYRSFGERCRLPNRRWKEIAAGGGGAGCLAFSSDGLRLAAAVADSPRGQAFDIVVYK